MDQATLIKVRDECRKDFERVKKEFGGSQSAAEDMWGLDNLEAVISRLLKEAGETPKL